MSKTAQQWNAVFPDLLENEDWSETVAHRRTEDNRDWFAPDHRAPLNNEAQHRETQDDILNGDRAQGTPDENETGDDMQASQTVSADPALLFTDTANTDNADVGVSSAEMPEISTKGMYPKTAVPIRFNFDAPTSIELSQDGFSGGLSGPTLYLIYTDSNDSDPQQSWLIPRDSRTAIENGSLAYIFNFGDGDDSFEIVPCLDGTVKYKMDVDMGGGNDFVSTWENPYLPASTFWMGSGNDVANVCGSSPTSDEEVTRVLCDDGDDIVNITGGGYANVFGDDGNDTLCVQQNGAFKSGVISLTGGAGYDTFLVTQHPSSSYNLPTSTGPAPIGRFVTDVLQDLLGWVPGVGLANDVAAALISTTTMAARQSTRFLNEFSGAMDGQDGSVNISQGSDTYVSIEDFDPLEDQLVQTYLHNTKGMEQYSWQSKNVASDNFSIAFESDGANVSSVIHVDPAIVETLRGIEAAHGDRFSLPASDAKMKDEILTSMVDSIVNIKKEGDNLYIMLQGDGGFGKQPVDTDQVESALSAMQSSSSDLSSLIANMHAGDQYYLLGNTPVKLGGPSTDGATNITLGDNDSNVMFAGTTQDWVTDENGHTSALEDHDGTHNSSAHMTSTMFGMGGDDIIYGSFGEDTIYGGDGNDKIQAGADQDFVWGDDGDDTIYGGLGNDVLVGGDGADRISGEAGDDIIYVGTKNEPGGHVSVGEFVDGGDGNDTIYIGSTYSGFFMGGDGNDTFYADRGSFNFVLAGAGDDVIYNPNRAYGESGADTFIFDINDINLQEGIEDFTHGEDKIELCGLYGLEDYQDVVDHLSYSADHSQATIDLGNGSVIAINLVGASELAESDFIFA
ncbi:calcium-binding protein [Martelella alba]|uniref:Calcium-binding protein n=1 Tax=Martelella alba TaxID=2590451 RepID=A0A506U1Q1_9HYPH|nr:calcium-binding protein [Martelella alba]TPW28303.1 calcium-binding protein [Martelella alba]